jgi:pimeloyl-ACP methyl ester carboxylesterase
LPGASAFFGRYEGGLYRIEIPKQWNGELVLFAHGLRREDGPQGDLLAPVFPLLLREHLIDRGFAWAASSYRCNGRVTGIGLLDTKALIDLFPKFTAGKAATRVYLTGQSMGGRITLLGLRHFPDVFGGGLAMCPADTDTTDFFTAVAAAAEYITGVQPTVATMQQDLATMSEVLGTPPSFTVKGRQLASIQLHISGGPRPFAGEGLAARFLANIADGVGDRPGLRAATNAHVRYSLDPGLGLDAEKLNAAVRRRQPDPELRKADGTYFDIVPFDGKLQRPLLTGHGTGDLYVPISMQRALKRSVDAAGASSMLVQRIMRIPGHCQFSREEQVAAFDGLVRWVRDAVTPAGDDVLGDLTDAGRNFTNPLRPGDPGTVRITDGGRGNIARSPAR